MGMTIMSETNLRQRVSEMFSASDNLSIELIAAFTSHELLEAADACEGSVYPSHKDAADYSKGYESGVREAVKIIRNRAE